MQTQHPTDTPLHSKRILDFSSLVNALDALQTVQRLTDEEVRDSRENRPLPPTSYAALAQENAWRMAVQSQSQDNHTMRRSRQTLGSSSSASATVAPLHQQETVRESDAEISTQFGGTPFVGGSTVRTALSKLFSFTQWSASLPWTLLPRHLLHTVSSGACIELPNSLAIPCRYQEA